MAQNTATTFSIAQAIDSPPVDNDSSTNVLSIGSRGQAVQALQNRLKESGYYNGPIDGIYGLATQRSVRTFQESQGLDITGRLNNETWAALETVGSSTQNQPSDSSSDAVSDASAAEGVEGQPTANETSDATNATGVETADAAEGSSSLGRLLGVGLGLVALVASFGIGFFLANRTKDDAIAAEEDSWGEVNPVEGGPMPSVSMSKPMSNGVAVGNGSNGNGYATNGSLAMANNTLSTSGQMGGTAPLAQADIVDGLIQDLHNPDPSKRRKVIWELGQRGNSLAVNPLVDAMVNADSKEKSLVLAALSEIGIRSLKPMNRALAIALQDENPEVRKNAIRDLTRIYELVVQISQMLGHATEDEDPEVRQTATWALEQLNRIRRTQDVDSTMRAFPSGSGSAKPIDLLSSEASLRRSQSERL